MSSIVKSSLAAAVFALACLFAAPGQAAQVDMTDVIFKEVEKRLIREYFATQGGGRDEDRDSGRRYGKGHGGKGQSGRDIGEKYRKKYEKTGARITKITGAINTAKRACPRAWRNETACLPVWRNASSCRPVWPSARCRLV